jgi:putative membrane protein
MIHGDPTAAAFSAELLFAFPFAFALSLYAAGVVIERRRGRAWPWYRSTAWATGVVLAAAGFVGPLAAAAHHDVVAHMWAHLAVGMTAPLLLVLGAPVTLALRSLHVSRARRLSRLLRSLPARFVGTPIVAAILSTGVLWVLYTGATYRIVQEDPLLHVGVSLHFLIAGCLFTAAIIPIDPAPHRAGYRQRMAVLIVTMAAHSILAKRIYGHPPLGMDPLQAQSGAMLMYYAGGLVDAVIVTILCAQWYRESGRRLLPTAHLQALPSAGGGYRSS